MKKISYVHVIKTPIFDPSGKVVGTQGYSGISRTRRTTEYELTLERRLLRDHCWIRSLIMFTLKMKNQQFIRCSRELSDRLGLKDPECR
jgi:hypothetical protein